MPLPPRDSPAAVGRVLMRDEAHARIRQLIVDGQLAPGERLRDDELAEWLGASRTPIREALFRLADEGLIDVAANRYTRVRPLERRDAADGYPVAAAMHGLAAEAAAATCGREDLSRLRDEADRFTWATWRADAAEAMSADVALHAVIVNLAANRELASLIDRLDARLRRLETAVWPQVGPRRPGHHHEALLDALGSAAGPAAAAAAIDEWRTLGRLVEAALAH